MPDPLDITVTLRTPPGGLQPGQVYQTPANETAQKNLIDLYKTHYAEAMNGYRYFGTLRSQIAWIPAVIAITLISYFSDKVALPDPRLNYAAPVFLALVLATIFLANLYLQGKQSQSTAVSRQAQQRLNEAIAGTLPVAATFYDLLATTPRRWFRRKPDGASILLFVFFFLVVLGHAAIVYQRVHYPVSLPNSAVPAQP